MIALPRDFVQRVNQERKDAEQLLDSLDEQAPVSVRINPRKAKPDLNLTDTIPWCETGYYLHERPSFTLDPWFHAGAYYPQEAGSMFLDFVLKQLSFSDTCVALDLCAAPGGKSTIILDNLSENSLLVSNEIIRNRAFILRDNLSKWGNSNVLVTNRKAEDFGQLQGLFDLILVDAPCSGEGMFRKDPNARSEWSLGNAQNCALRQTEILEDIWPSLKSNGVLVYSTCTFNPAENDDQIKKMLENHDCELVNLDLPEAFGLEKQDFGFACLPHKMQTEGFYFAVLRKTESTSEYNKHLKRKQTKAAPLAFPFSISENCSPVDIDANIFIVPSSQKDLMQHLKDQLGCMKFGTWAGTMIKNKLNPHHEWALSHSDLSAFPKIELDKDEALLYLKGNAIAPRGSDGWQIVSFQNVPLGWIKKIGNRTNNYYPKELRIRMEINS